MNIDFPFQIDGHGRTAATGNDDHVRDLIEQILFTNPGERVNRPTFGSGLLQMVFQPNSSELAAALQFTLQAALQQWQDTLQRLMPISPGSAAAAAAGDPDPRDSEGAIVAPFNGVVDSVALSAGQMVDPSQPVFTVADLSTVWVPLQVPEDQIGAVQVGDAVALTVDAYPGRTFTGRVAYIADKVDPNTGTVMVRCEVSNPDGALRINMFANATIAAPLNRSAVLVPDSALQNVNGQQAVFSPTGSGHFAWHTVHPGLSTGGYTQILSGIAPGTPIVTDGSYWLKATLLAQTIPSE